jgi:hypothetical protein
MNNLSKSNLLTFFFLLKYVCGKCENGSECIVRKISSIEERDMRETVNDLSTLYTTAKLAHIYKQDKINLCLFFYLFCAIMMIIKVKKI